MLYNLTHVMFPRYNLHALHDLMTSCQWSDSQQSCRPPWPFPYHQKAAVPLWDTNKLLSQNAGRSVYLTITWWRPWRRVL